VVDAAVVASRSNFGFGGPQPDLRLSGFLLEDQGFDPVKLDIRDPRTGLVHTFTVIGVLAETAPQFMLGITVSQTGMNSAFGAVAPSIYLFKLAPGVDPATTADRMEAAFVANGMQVDDLRKLLRDGVGASLTFTYIILGFMGLGLIVGVAALGVISARAVVERRQQIGVLRSIGLQRRMIEATFLLESSLISLTAILLGTVLGLVVAYNVIAQSASQPSWGNLEFAVPWWTLTIVFVTVYAASLLATIIPARRGARVRPAEALRYQ
jgi:putative ABC transport system permease protein